VPAAPEGVPKPEYFAHESAYVDQPWLDRRGTKIWHFAHVLKGATIGENCVIGQNVVIASSAVIGNGVKIQNTSPCTTASVLEDGVFCGPSMVFNQRHQPAK